MQPLNINEFTTEEVMDALHGRRGKIEHRLRFKVVDLEGLPIRESENVSGSIKYKADDQIKTSASLEVVDKNITLPSFATLASQISPLLWWRFGESSGTTAADSSGNTSNGTHNGAPVLAQDSLLAGDTASPSIRYTGANYTSAPHKSAYNVSQFTVLVWGNTAATSGTLFCMDDGTNQRLRIDLDGSGNVRVKLYFTTGLPLTITPEATINEGGNFFLAVSYDGAFVRIWIDAILVKNPVAETRTLKTPSVSINVGRNNQAANYWNGLVDEVMFCGSAVSSADIRKLHQSGSGNLAEIDYERDRLKITDSIKMLRAGADGEKWAEFSLGTFLLEAPVWTMTPTGLKRIINAFDQTAILVDDAIDSRYVVEEGDNYITKVQEILISSGFPLTAMQLTPTGLEFTAQRSWNVGTPKIEIINNMLEAISYNQLWFNGNGIVIVEPYIQPVNRSVEYAYSTDLLSVMEPIMERTTNRFEIPNKVIVGRSNPKTNGIEKATWTNTKFSSPTSYAKRGNRWKTFVDLNIDAADTDSLQAIADKTGIEKSQKAETVKLYTSLMPMHAHLDCVTITANRIKITGKHIQYERTFPLSPDGRMEHIYRKAY
jgi:hypothetical protein